MNALFECSPFKGDISRWNTSNVQDMRGMFYDNRPGCDISEWCLDALAEEGDQMVFSEFHDSPLGYLGILRGEYSFPEDDQP